jgi:hypothetical protein
LSFVLFRHKRTVGHVFIWNVFVVAAAERRCVIFRCVQHA